MRKKRRARRAEVALIYGLLPTLQLEVRGRNTGGAVRDTHIFLTRTGVFYGCAVRAAYAIFSSIYQSVLTKCVLSSSHLCYIISILYIEDGQFM